MIKKWENSVEVKMKQAIKLTDVFEVATLQEMQDLFSTATGLAAVIVDCKGNPVTQYSGFCEYCIKMRQDPRFCQCCFRSDAFGGIDAARTGKPSFYICHGGLVDLAVPIVYKGNYLGAVLAGQLRLSESEMIAFSMDKSTELTDLAEVQEMSALKNRIPTTTAEKVKSASMVLERLVEHLVLKQDSALTQLDLKETKRLLKMEQTKISQMETTVKESSLKALQSQVNPHFLFNTLNTIGRLAMIEKAIKTQEIIYTFSDMMRYTLKKENSDFVTIEEEIQHVRNYLAIQKMRLGNRLEYEINVHPACSGALCPFMTIQPLVENAINHAVDIRASEGKIVISAFIENQTVIITVKDNGPGVPNEIKTALLNGTYTKDEKDKGMGTGIGITNADQRIKYFFGEKYGIAFNDQIENGTEVMITMPIMALPGKGLYKHV